MFKLTELWDNIAYTIYNFFALLRFWLVDRWRYGKMLRHNRELKNKHSGERCFIVLNGPSINKCDLSRLTNETTICANYFYLSDHVDAVHPDYYCICDSDTFLPERRESLDALLKKCDYSSFIFNKKARAALAGSEPEKCYYVYGMHMPTLRRIRGDLAGLSSSFINVGMFCMMCAVYMGFKEIYVLGNDFAPGGGLAHCYGNTAAEKQVNEVYRRRDRQQLCCFYWCYYLAHLQNFYIERFAAKNGAHICNLNPESYIRAFDFADYDEVTGAVSKK